MPEIKQEKTDRYFIAIIPPPPFFEEIVTLKKYCKENYNSKAALNSPPHVTLHMPFLWKKTKENILLDSLESFAKQYSPIELSLADFGSFPPRVIFITVPQTIQLNDLHQNLHRFCKEELNLFNANYKDLPFHPHVTIAFRDLKKSLYQPAWEEFKNKKYTATFTSACITLLKHTGKRWEICKDFPLQPC